MTTNDQPSRLSEHLAEMVDKHKTRYRKRYCSGFIRQFIGQAKLQLLYLDEYQNILEFAKSYRVKKGSIRDMFKQFDEIADRLALSELLLGHAFVAEKHSVDKIRIPVITKEDMKHMALADLSSGKIDVRRFKSEFGHYAENPFELSCKRFHEYGTSRLMELAEDSKDHKLDNKMTLDRYIKKKQPLFPIYAALREELRYLALLVVSELRSGLLELQKQKKIDNVFDTDPDEVISLDK